MFPLSMYNAQLHRAAQVASFTPFSRLRELILIRLMAEVIVLQTGIIIFLDYMDHQLKLCSVIRV
jgi:hypothetical protein